MDSSEKEQLRCLNEMVMNSETITSEQASLHEFLKKKDIQSSRLVFLEEEADLLALENERLRNLLLENNIDPSGRSLHKKEPSTTEQIDVLVEGDGHFPNTAVCRIENACGSLNALSVCHCVVEGVPTVACGGVDKVVRIYDISVPSNPREIFQHGLSAPVLSVQFKNGLLACALMDGGHAVIDTTQIHIDNGDAVLSADDITRCVCTGKIHIKFVVNTDWSCDGSFMLTCSQDKSVGLHRRSVGGDFAMDLVTQLRFAETPECAIFVPADRLPTDWYRGSNIDAESGAGGDPFMVVALRGVCYLLYINCVTYEMHRVSLNEHEWDEHVSFTVLHLALSPCGKYIVAATDKDMHIVYKVGTRDRVRVLAGGHSSDTYARPKVVWDSTSSYLYCNSQSDFAMCVYSLCSGRVVSSLKHHTGQIRDIASHPSERLLLTASYDHTVAQWAYQ